MGTDHSLITWDAPTQDTLMVHLWQTAKYVTKIQEAYEWTFGSKPKKGRPPLEESDHPGLDTSELCNNEQIRQYLTLIRQLMWAVTLGRLAIAASVMTMPRLW